MHILLSYEHVHVCDLMLTATNGFLTKTIDLIINLISENNLVTIVE